MPQFLVALRRPQDAFVGSLGRLCAVFRVEAVRILAIFGVAAAFGTCPSVLYP